VAWRRPHAPLAGLHFQSLRRRRVDWRDGGFGDNAPAQLALPPEVSGPRTAGSPGTKPTTPIGSSLAEPDAGTASVLIDEQDAGSLESRLYLLSSLGSAA
jgi:hypothetical protein